MLFDGKTALVTGAGGRLGRAIAAALSREGAAVAALDVNARAAEETARRLTARPARPFTADVSDEEQVRSALDAVERDLAAVDVLVNAHGIFPNRPLLDVDVEEWDQVFAVNVRGTMLTCREVARRWVRRGTAGSIVNVSSAAATSARSGGGHYCGSKAAVNLLTHCLAIELGPRGIRVNAVAPGLVFDEVVTDPGGQHPYVQAMLRGTPLRRTGDPAEVAEAVAFLASERSAWTTGAIFEVTGGSHCGRTHVPASEGLR